MFFTEKKPTTEHSLEAFHDGIRLRIDADGAQPAHHVRSGGRGAAAGHQRQTRAADRAGGRREEERMKSDWNTHTPTHEMQPCVRLLFPSDVRTYKIFMLNKYLSLSNSSASLSQRAQEIANVLCDDRIQSVTCSRCDESRAGQNAQNDDVRRLRTDRISIPTWRAGHLLGR